MFREKIGENFFFNLNPLPINNNLKMNLSELTETKLEWCNVFLNFLYVKIYVISPL